MVYVPYLLLTNYKQDLENSEVYEFVVVKCKFVHSDCSVSYMCKINLESNES